jgi:hypothetical protein
VSRGAAGRAASFTAQAARRQARIEDLEFLLETGEAPARAALRAGWPSLAAAEVALRREQHPAWTVIARVLRDQRSHRTQKDTAA